MLNAFKCQERVTSSKENAFNRCISLRSLSDVDVNCKADGKVQIPVAKKKTSHSFGPQTVESTANTSDRESKCGQEINVRAT